MADRFEPGQQILMREMWRGRLWAARPMTVVRDDDDLIAVYMAIGSPWKCPRAPDGGVLRMPWRDWILEDLVWERLSFLHLIRPGEAHSSMAAFHPDGSFWGWYINLQEPLRRSPFGFDYMDQMLDILVTPDGLIELKDEDELQEEVERGLMTPPEAEAVRAEAAKVIERIRGDESPFGDGWEHWRPDPSWPIPNFPSAGLE